MPRVIDCPSEERIELAELVEMLETGDFDAEDEDNFASWGAQLKKLANDRNFLADLMIAELKNRCGGQVGSQYSAQVVILHARSQKFLIRANLWPAMQDSVIRHSGTNPFFYHIPHDHNFSFLTVGYLGPGYWSDYYEYDYGKVVGYPGEEVPDLRFVEKTRLEEGKVMLYRAHKDIHRQLPADSMSVSLNIVQVSYSTPFRDQYCFDLENKRIAGNVPRVSLEPMLALAAHFGGGNGVDLLDDFARSHPCDRIRWSALRARAAAAPTLDARIALFEEGARTDALLVSALARREAERLEASRAWIEEAPALDDRQSAA